MNFSSDLCTLSTLTESTLLSSIKERNRDELTESYVGGVLLSLGASSNTSGSRSFLPSFASSVLRSLVFSYQDQSILISGHHTRDNHALADQFISALLEHVEQLPKHLASAILVCGELLSFLCCCEDQCGEAVVVVAITVNPATLAFTAAKLSCLLLDTSRLTLFKVFSQQDAFHYVEDCLEKLSMPQWLVKQLMVVLKTVQDLICGVQTAKALGESCAQVPQNLPDGNTVAQLLYAYFVQWLVMWINGNCFGGVVGETEGNDCTVSVICAPGHCVNDGMLQAAGTSGLPALITRYANEVLHNLCCSRLFVWEQDQYMEEGMEWDTVEVEFNQSLIDAFHQEGGLLEVLGLPSVAEMKAGVENSCHFSFNTCFMSGEGDRFTVTHYTGEYDYVIDAQWKEDNEIHVAGSVLRRTLQNSSCGVLVDMAKNMQYSADLMPSGERIQSCKLTQRAKVAMEAVCDLITTSHPHFVFCLKPSEDEENVFNSEFVLNQLQQFKILDIALIQSCGFPIRLKHSHFIKNYEALLVHGKSPTISDREKCFAILDGANLKEWHVGKTMVMLKPWHRSQLDSALDLYNQSAKKLQRVFRQSISKKNRLPKSMSTDMCPPSPPPRPSHTLPTSQHPTSSDYDRATSPQAPPQAPSNVHRKKPSWRKSSSSTHRKSVPTPSDLQAHSWFQGRLSREKAEERLKLVEYDCFLIRESENRVGEYALSLRHAGTVKHFRVDTKRGPSVRYELYGAKRSFPSVEELVDYYSHHCISSGGELLTQPYSSEKQASPKPLKRKLSSIRRPKPALTTVPVNESRFPRTKTTPTFSNNHHAPFKEQSLDLSDDSMAQLRRELEVEEKIVAAARRMAELPSGNRRERHKRKQSLQQAQSRLLSLRQQFHTLQERQLFIEVSMQNATATHSS